MEKIANLHIEVPHRAAGNIIKNKMIEFDVYQDATQYKAVPLCKEEERILANLPPELWFYYEGNQIRSDRGPHEGNTHVMNSIVEALKQQQLVD